MAGRVLNRHHDKTAQGIYIGRGSPYGNPFQVGKNARNRDDAIRKFTMHILPYLDLSPLLGHDLICSCKPKPCHGDPIIWALYRGL